MKKFISIGIDVAADFSIFAIMTPTGELFRQPFKVVHTDLTSIENAVSTIKKAEEQYMMKSQIFLESTGIFHLPLFCYLKESGFEVFVLNPLITHSNKNFDIRKVKNDKFDAIRIAKLGFNENIKKSVVPDSFVLNLRCLCREYFSLTDNRTALINKLSNNLRIAFPAVFNVFSKVHSCACLAVLEAIDSLYDLISKPAEEVTSLIAKSSRRGLKYAQNKYNLLIDAAKTSKKLSQTLPNIFMIIKTTIKLIKAIDEELSSILKTIESIVDGNSDNDFVKQIHFLDSIPGIGFFSAVALMCEIGDFSTFKNSKQLFAYFGIDPSVNESGKFKGTKNHMSKRGSKFARRVLFAAALASVRTSKNGKAVNSVLKEYYQKKTASKPKKVALGAVMHKLCNICFSLLKNNSNFVLKTPDQHKTEYLAA